MREIAKFSKCFVCGEKNESGLKARFFAAVDNSVESSYTVEERFAGYAGILHGGILAALLDEVMIKAIFKDNILCVTAEMEINFKRPVRIGQTVRLIGRVLQQKGRIFKTEGIARVNDELVACATGTYLMARGDLEEMLSASLDQ